MSEAERQCRINHIDYQTVKHDDEQVIMTDIKADETYWSYNNVTGGHYETTGFRRVKNEDGGFTDYFPDHIQVFSGKGSKEPSYEQYQYVYEQNGQKIVRTEKRVLWSTGDTNKPRTTITYSQMKEDGTIGDTIRTDTYNDDGHQIQSTIEHGGLGNEKITYNYEYDDEGKLIREFYEEGDNKNIEINYDETGEKVSSRTYDAEGNVVRSQVAESITFGGKKYTFNANELTAIVGSLETTKTNLSTQLMEISAQCSEIASLASSHDSGVSGTMNNLGTTCETCKTLISQLIETLQTDINTYVDNTIANEYDNSKELQQIDSSLDEISGLFDSIGN